MLLRKNTEPCHKQAKDSPRKYFPRSQLHSDPCFKSTIFINFSACVLFCQSANHVPKNLTLDISFLALCVVIPRIIIFYASFLRQMKGESMSKLSIHWWLLCRYEGHIEYSNSLFEKCIACCRTLLSLTNVAFSLKARLETIQTGLWSIFQVKELRWKNSLNTLYIDTVLHA